MSDDQNSQKQTTEPQDGERWLISIAWWWDDVKATYRDGQWIPDGYEHDPMRHFPPKYVSQIERLDNQP